MNKEQIAALRDKQRAYFQTGTTLPVAFRKEQLKKLYGAIVRYRPRIEQALTADLGKSPTEGYMCEIGMTLAEITYIIRHVGAFSRKKTVATPLAQFASHSYVQPVPYGNTLIMSPWNYPFMLTVEPLADAIAAGNTAIVKPAAYSPATSKVIAEMLGEIFPEEYVAVVTGSREENNALLDQRFDLVFFTGSQAVGREVLRRCAEHLTPAVLELGGKSPCIVDATADIPLAAKRIVFGKYLNCGQTCVAPDYILCERSVKDAFLREVKKQIGAQFGADPLTNPDYGKIINRKHFDRIMGLIDPEKVVHGGNADAESLRIAPTVMDGVTENDPVMREEIFGPVMPVLVFDDFGTVIERLKQAERPLAAYLFTSDKAHRDRYDKELAFGGGCVNDVIIHLATSGMGFGGVGASGMGAYHGKAGFDAFSHKKSVIDKKTWLDLPMRYQPYTSKLNQKLLELFLK
ncbi:MAG: aldehyde dehydrogenase [Clostridia bacterium]|nr:aldehyde dehydrogenase [Clostridia bacterium]